MSDTRKRPAFSKEWWDKTGQFLEDNPEIGFEDGDQKQFIKWLVNRFVENEGMILPENKVREIFKEAGAEKALEKAMKED